MQALDTRLVSLERQLSDLATRVGDLESNRVVLREPLPSEALEQAEEADDSLAGLVERLTQLEQIEKTRQRQALPQVDDWRLHGQRRTAHDPIETAHATIRDTEVSDLEKAHAWLDLAQQDAYPWTDDIIAQMMSIGLTSKDDRAREVVWIGVETQHRSDLLVQPLISALSDPVANVREEAADALSSYLSMPGVQRALVWTSNNDESETVRNEALMALREEE